MLHLTIDDRDKCGPLLYALRLGHSNIAYELVNADCNMCIMSTTNNKSILLKLFFRRGRSPTSSVRCVYHRCNRDSQGRTALYTAASLGDLNMANILLRAGPGQIIRTLEEKNTSLFTSIFSKSSAVAKHFLTPISMDIRKTKNLSPLHSFTHLWMKAVWHNL